MEWAMAVVSLEFTGN